jgi:adenosylhomocysteinase
VDRDTYYKHIALALGAGDDGGDGAAWAGAPDLVLDDGGDLVSTLHTMAPPAVLDRVRGGCEGTTTGVLRLRRMTADGTLAFPVIAASDTPVTRIVDNTHGTAQSVLDGLLRASGILLAGKAVVVAGFGARARRPGAGHRGRPGARARRGAARLPGAADRRGRPGGRGLHHRDRLGRGDHG